MFSRGILWIMILMLSQSLFGDPANNHRHSLKFTYWDNLSRSDKENILRSIEIDTTAIDYLKGKYRATDDQRTKRLLSVITTKSKNSKKSMVYFFIFNEICLNADGALSEILGNYCQNIILNYPEYVINYFRSNRQVLDTYANILGGEFYFKEQGKSTLKYDFKEFKQIVEKEIKEENKYRKILEEFYMKIKSAMVNQK